MFEDDPRGITAAHNCTMMAIALIGAHPAYVFLHFVFRYVNDLHHVNKLEIFCFATNAILEMWKSSYHGNYYFIL